MRSLGLEIEMPVACRDTGASHKVGPYFGNLAQRKADRGQEVRLEQCGGRDVAVHSGCIVSGVDNAFNNLESSIGPVCDACDNLSELYAILRGELEDVSACLEQEGAMVVNFSEHPDVRIDQDYYRWIRSPKPIYEYWVGYRGWNHMAGVDAKAHNGPTTGVDAADAVRACNILLAASPAFIALFANSPFEAGCRTGQSENRMTIWSRIFSTSRFACDRWLHRMPERPFAGLGDYFRWMFGPGTNMQFVTPNDVRDYKKPGGMLLVEGDPPLLEFLRGSEWQAKPLSGGDAVLVRPSMRHLEFQQFCHFLDARIRYAFSQDFPVAVFLEALDAGEERLTRLFQERTSYCYIEGRAAGANQPDKFLAALPDPRVAASTTISVSALQTGLLENPEAAWGMLSGFRWEDLRGLRQAAVEHGMRAEYNGLAIRNFCAAVLEAAGQGLNLEDTWMLGYPLHVLRTGENGADRAVKLHTSLPGDDAQRMAALVRERAMVLP